MVIDYTLPKRGEKKESLIYAKQSTQLPSVWDETFSSSNLAKSERAWKICVGMFVCADGSAACVCERDQHMAGLWRVPFSFTEALVNMFNRAITGRKCKHDFDIQQCVSYVFFLKISTVASEIKIHSECWDAFSHQSMLTYPIQPRNMPSQWQTPA